MDFKEIIRLPKPDLRKSEYLGYNIGLRPKRDVRIRTEVEKLKEKIIVHNYGHGGKGVVRSFGSAKIAQEKFFKYLKEENLTNEKKKAVVLGSG